MRRSVTIASGRWLGGRGTSRSDVSIRTKSATRVWRLRHVDSSRLMRGRKMPWKRHQPSRLFGLMFRYSHTRFMAASGSLNKFASKWHREAYVCAVFSMRLQCEVLNFIKWSKHHLITYRCSLPVHESMDCSSQKESSETTEWRQVGWLRRRLQTESQVRRGIPTPGRFQVRIQKIQEK